MLYYYQGQIMAGNTLFCVSIIRNHFLIGFLTQWCNLTLIIGGKETVFNLYTSN